MLPVALLIFILSFYFPYWIARKKRSESRAEITRKQVFFELSPVLTCFVFSFVLIVIITLTGSKKHLLNKDAIYGIESNQLIEKWGFLEGDKILKINGEEVMKFYDITLTLINSEDDPVVEIERNQSIQTITLNSTFLLSELMEAGSNHPTFIPKNPELLNFTKESYSFSDGITSYTSQFKLFSQFLPSSNGYENSGRYLTLSEIRSQSGYLYLLSFCLIFFGLISLIPLPGFALGNSLVVVIQKVGNKQFNQKLLQRVRIFFQGIFLLLLLIFLVWNSSI